MNQTLGCELLKLLNLKACNISFDAWFLIMDIILIIWDYDRVCVRFIYLGRCLERGPRGTSEFQIDFWSWEISGDADITFAMFYLHLQCLHLWTFDCIFKVRLEMPASHLQSWCRNYVVRFCDICRIGVLFSFAMLFSHLRAPCSWFLLRDFEIFFTLSHILKPRFGIGDFGLENFKQGFGLSDFYTFFVLFQESTWIIYT